VHEMRFLTIKATALAGSVSALKVLEHDKLATLGLQNVAKDVAKNGYPSPGTCTLENAARRREWYVFLEPCRGHITNRRIGLFSPGMRN